MSCTGLTIRMNGYRTIHRKWLDDFEDLCKAIPQELILTLYCESRTNVHD